MISCLFVYELATTTTTTTNEDDEIYASRLYTMSGAQNIMR